MRSLFQNCMILVLLSFAGCGAKVSSSRAAPSLKSAVNLNEPFDSSGRYIDSFSDLSGAIQKFENGVQVMPTAQRTRLVFPFGAASTEPLVLKAVEVQQAKGFDEKPGLLALSWDTLPSTLAYSGFVYQGRTVQPIRLPLLHAARSADDLDSLHLRFRYKGLKPNSTDVAFSVRCRVEPNVPEAYEYRLELMTINVTDQWQLFEAILGDGGNSKAFLQLVSSESFDGNFKVSWSQNGPIANYLGATLLIDDLEIGSIKNDASAK